MSELPGYSPYGVPPPPSASSSTSLAPSTSTAPPAEPSPSYVPQPIIRLPKRNMAGPVQTISLADKQHDYFQATRTSPFTLTAPTSYSIHLTADPTPLYRIEVDPRPTADPAIQLFDLDDPFPVAVARMHPHVIPEAAVCTREPAGPNAIWHPFSDNYAVLYVESVPGLPAVQRGVRWWPKQTKNLTCSIIGSLFGIPEEDMTLARYGMLGTFGADMVLQVVRGGGIECELGIVMQLFVRLELDRRRNAKKGKKR